MSPLSKALQDAALHAGELHDRVKDVAQAIRDHTTQLGTQTQILIEFRAEQREAVERIEVSLLKLGALLSTNGTGEGHG